MKGRNVALLLGGLLAGGIIVGTARIASAQKVITNAIYIPMYIYPQPPIDLSSLTAIVSRIPIYAVMNPNNGDFSVGTGLVSAAQEAAAIADPNYVNQINALIQVGKTTNSLIQSNMTVVGYVYTGYATRDINIVKQRIRLWKQLYPGVTALHIDEMSPHAADAAYYQELTTYAKTLGFKQVFGNPGQAVEEGCIGSVDVIFIYEGSGLPSITTVETNTFAPKYPDSDFGLLAYNVPTYDINWTNMVGGMVHYIYVTPDSNAWNTISSYLADIATDLGQ